MGDSGRDGMALLLVTRAWEEVHITCSPHPTDISLEIWVHILHVQRNTSLFHSGVLIPSTASPWHQLPSTYTPTDSGTCARV